MRRIRVRRGSARRSGLVVAGAVATLFVGLVGWYASRAETRPTPRADLPDDPRIPDIKDRPILANSGAIPQVSGKEFFYQIADKDDPSRLAGYIKAKKADPGESRTYTLTEPEFWYFATDGRVMRFRADNGRAYIPSQEKGSRPESGVFKGNTIFELYETRQANRTIDPAVDKPVLVGRTAELQYEGAMGEVRAPGQVEVEAREGRFVGSNITIVLSEAKRQLRWALVDPGAKITIDPKASKSAKPPATPAAPPTSPSAVDAAPEKPADPSAPANSTSTAAAAPSKAPKEPVEAFFQVASSGGVLVEQGARTIRSNELRAWLRTIDSKLPPGALGASAPRPVSTSIPASPVMADVNAREISAGEMAGYDGSAFDIANKPPAPSAAAAAPQVSAAQASPPDAPVTITFTGPLEIKTIENRPAELGLSDLLVRFMGNDSTAAHFADAESKVEATGNQIQYAPTTGELALIGDAARAARLSLSGAGVASATRFDVNTRTGKATIAGAGSLVGEGKDGTSEGLNAIRWSQGANLSLLTRDGRVTSQVESFEPRGDVVAVDAAGLLKAEHFEAIFADIPDAPGKRYISHVSMRGDASAADAKGSVLSGESIDCDLTPTGKGENAIPSRLVVVGRAKAMQNDATFQADSIEADLAPGPDGKVAVTSAVGQGDVEYTAAGDVRASADKVIARPAENTADLTGTQVRIAQGGSSITGSQVRLEGGDSPRMAVFGAGTFTHEAPAKGASAPMKSHAAWTRQMRFDDRTGEMECAGDVLATIDSGELSTDTMKAERVRIWLTPGQPAQPAQAVALPAAPSQLASQPASPKGEKSERRLLRAEAIGAANEREGGSLASVESRRFSPTVPASGQRETERLTYLEGEIIRADNEKGSIDVPGRGRLFTLDHRALVQRAAQVGTSDSNASADRVAAVFADAGASRGEAKFEWSGSLSGDREHRTITLRQGVKMRHHRAADDLLTDLECAVLTASIAEPLKPVSSSQAAALSADFSGELRTARASGEVWLKSGTREITGAELLYDAVKGLVDVESPPGASVTVFDQGSATPVSARAIRWDLTTGRIDVIQPGTLVTPQ